MILGNSTMIPELSERMMTDHGQNFRDGLPYAHALVAVREVLDQQELPAWNSSVYGLWLAALRTLSEPTTDEQYPEAMRTRAWALKDVSTQLASWTHIRHDNVLYAKESYTPGTTCDYPAGFVEPRIRFWQAMNDLAAKTGALLQSLPFTGDVFISDADPFNPERWIPRSAIKDRQSAFLSQFADCMTTLAEISRKELAQERLTASETAFLKGLIEARFSYYGIRTFSGWYPSLFYVPVRKEVAYDTLHPSDRWDPVVVDVHTDQPDPLVTDPGAVLHEAVGNVNFCLIAINNGPDRMIYGGPVLSYYEFPINGIRRLTDQDWKTSLLNYTNSPPPEWTSPFLVRGAFEVPGWAR